MALSDERIRELALQISDRVDQLTAAGLVQDSPAEDMDPFERLAHMIAAKGKRRKVETAGQRGSNVIDASARFKSGR
jgi:hypothetical protein